MKVGDAVPQACLPPPTTGTPRLRPPPGAWDTHVHVIGAPPAFPWVSPRNYDPPPADAGALLAHLDALGIAFAVVVQVSVHGVDNSALLAALHAHPDRLRGVAVVAPDVTDAELERLHAAGVRGVRIVTLVAGGVGLAAVRPLAERVAPLGWHVQLATDGATLAEAAPSLRGLPTPLVLDHFGGCDPAEGVDGAGFRALRSLVGEGAYVKLSAAYRLDAPPWRALAPLARALIADAPERLLWASDWPHVALTDPARMPAPEATLDLLADWAPDEAARRAILVHNPAALYGLPPTASPGLRLDRHAYA